MKKRFSFVVLLGLVLVCMPGCGEKKEDANKSGKSAVEETKDAKTVLEECKTAIKEKDLAKAKSYFSKRYLKDAEKSGGASLFGLGFAVENVDLSKMVPKVTGDILIFSPKPQTQTKDGMTITITAGSPFKMVKENGQWKIDKQY